MRLDQYVAHSLSVSRAFADKLIEQAKVSVNEQPQLKSGYKVRESDKVDIDYEAASEQKIPEIDLPILYEDRSCIVINKPAGVLSHSKGTFNPEATVATWLSSRVKGLSGDRAGIVHRLDRATSGVMICAKTPEALVWLQKQFSDRKVEKTYLAVISGELDPVEAVVDMPIERNPKKPQTFRVGSGGKPAVTTYKQLSTNGKYSLVELTPKTGRTHQLRVHLSYLKHPILGDTLYGGEPADRLYLHAKTLRLALPSRQEKTFEVNAPPEFEEVMK